MTMSPAGVIRDGAVAAASGHIVAVGPTRDVLGSVEVAREAVVVEARGRAVIPGFVDAHTHLVFAGSREQEMVMRLGGATHRDILEAGGGINSTARATREADEDELLGLGVERLDSLLVYGTTTVEVKSGYGLTPEDELKCLRVIRRLGEVHAVDVVPTFMGAHALPPEYAGDRGGYVKLVVEEMLPRVAAKRLAEACDVFCEKGAFSLEESRRILLAAKRLGMKVKVHADELSWTGGAELAAEVGALSADHLTYASKAGAEKMGEAGVVATLLPGTWFFLMLDGRPPVEEFKEAGVTVALATDFNPGTCPTWSMQMMVALACLRWRLPLEEALAAATRNAARALAREREVGSLEPGKKADMVVLKVDDPVKLAYHFGVNLVEKVVKEGRLVVDGGVRRSFR